MRRLRIGLLALITTLITSVLALGTATSATAAGTIETVLQFQPAAVFRDSFSGSVSVPASVRLLNKATGAEIAPSVYGDYIGVQAFTPDGNLRANTGLKPSVDSAFGLPFSFGDMDVVASFDGNGIYAAAKSVKFRVVPETSTYPTTATLGATPASFAYGESVTVPVTVSSAQIASDRIRGRGTLFVDGVAKPWFPITNGAGEVVIDGDLIGTTGRSHTLRVSFTGGGAAGDSNTSYRDIVLKAVSTVEVTSVPATSVYGTPTRLAMKVTTKPAWPSALSLGTITAYDGADRTTHVGTSLVQNDTATVFIDALLSAGQHDVQLVFTPSRSNTEAEYIVPSPPTSQSVTIQKLTPVIGLALTPTQVTPTGTAAAKVTVSHTSVASSNLNGGTVTLVGADGNPLGNGTPTGTLSNGVANITIPAGTFVNGTTNAIRARLSGHPNLADVTSSSQTLKVLNKFQSAVSLPTISAPKGPRVGETVGVVDPNPAWTPTTGYKYQWLLDGDPLKNADGTDATGTTYVIKASDVRGLDKGQLQVRVTSTRADYEETSQVSAAMRVIGTTTVSKPTLSDPTAVKVGKQVTATVTGWPANTQWKYEWFVGGVSKGAASTTNAYTPVAADAEKALTVRVTGTPDGFDPISETSEASTVIGVFQTKPAPTISSSTTGGVRVGSVLTAEVADWEPTQGSFTYQWFRSGTTGPVGTGKTYTVTSEDKTQTLRVEATGHRNGYDDATVSSNATAAVTEGKFDATVTKLSDVPLKGIPVKASTEFWSPKLTGVTPQYQWYRGTTATNGTPIGDATASSYTPLATDVGSYLSVKVTGTLPGYETVSGTSEPKQVLDVYFDKNPPPTITGTVKTGNTVSANNPTWIPTTGFTYQWMLGGEDIPNATSREYAIKQEDAGKELRVRVKSTKAGFEEATSTSAATRVIGVHRNLNQPVIQAANGVYVGASVTATTPSWPNTISKTYEWFAGTTSLGEPTDSPDFVVPASAALKQLTVRVRGTQPDYDPVDLTSAARAVEGVFTAGSPTVTSSTGEFRVGATLTAQAGTWGPEQPTFTVTWFRDGFTDPVGTGPTYKVVAADRNNTIHAAIKATRGGYVPMTVNTNSTPTIEEGRYSAHTVKISGDVVAGNIVYASTADWAPEEPTQREYQWYLTDVAGNTTPINAFTGQAYVPQRVDVGKKLSVRVTGTSPGFEQIIEYSPKVTITVLPEYDATHAPTISVPAGGAKPGTRLTVAVEKWAPETDFDYRWTLDGQSIPGESGRTYDVRTGDANGKIRVEITSKLATRERTILVSEPVTIQPIFATSTKPVITGTGEIGKELTVTTGDWDPKPTFTYEWVMGVDNEVVSTASRFTPNANDVGRKVSVRVTAKATTGAELTLTSDPVTIIPVKVTPPASKPGTVTIPGAGKVGTTVTATTAGWPTGAALQYQWLRAGAPIGGATGASYTLTAGDFRQLVAVRVTAAGTDLTATSGALTVTAGALKAGTVKVSGTAKSGKTLKAATVGWPAGVKLTYQWLRNGTAISKATKASYKLTKSDKKKKISVRVTATRTGYSTVTKTSTAVKAR